MFLLMIKLPFLNLISAIFSLHHTFCKLTDEVHLLALKMRVCYNEILRN